MFHKDIDHLCFNYYVVTLLSLYGLGFKIFFLILQIYLLLALLISLKLLLILLFIWLIFLSLSFIY